MVAVQAAAGTGFASNKARAKGRKQQRRQQQPQRRPVQQEDDADELSELSQAQHVITVPEFAPELCEQLRQVTYLPLYAGSSNSHSSNIVCTSLDAAAHTLKRAITCIRM